MHPDHQVEMVAHNTETQYIHAVQDFQALDEVQEIGFVYIVDRQSSQGSSGYHMVNGTLGISHKAGYTGHGTPPGEWLVGV
jgi:hypothetical protein